MLTMDTLVDRFDETLSARRVFGEPVVKNGLTVIPVARIMGGAGGGENPTEPGSGGAEGTESKPRQPGFGAGFGLAARPAGVYVLQGDKVQWLPALDVNRVVLGMQVVAIVLLLTIRSIARARAAHA